MNKFNIKKFLLCVIITIVTVVLITTLFVFGIKVFFALIILYLIGCISLMIYSVLFDE